MKKPLLSFLVLSLIVLNGNAQTKGTFNFSLGPSIPLGEYASKSASDPNSGLANVGAVADLSYQHPFAGNTRFGWMATLRGRFNTVNKNALLTAFEPVYPDYQWSVKSGHWTAAAALVGAYYQWPLTSKLSLQANAEIGVAESWSPKETVTGQRDSAGRTLDLVVGNVNSVSATSFTALAGLGVRYKLKGHWSLIAQLDYNWLEPTFKNVTTNVVMAQGFVVPGITLLSNASSLEENSQTANYKQPMSCIDVRVGLAWEF